MIEYLVAGIIILFIVTLFWDILKKALSTVTTLILNGVAGILILLFVNTYLGWSIPLNIPTVLISGLFGIPGVGALILLHLFGMI